ncbi:30S ribosome-binding factor RbfA [Thiotrichales bacterium 19S11-10]|nr:30S ribosome-binding factor RbfA [Thiotrichales bacterium 19S11-10]MCF6807004.1 30S ribosome-binding factor RbfA [Thiotrichales bacterium 19S9-11]MCF6810973.1 30S ribosome-binding factor RbfA [Thiotrichales bacterium 19S9-12]
MASSSRIYRVADEIQRLIVDAIRRKIRDPKFQWVSISSVEVSKDLAYAKVYYTSLSEDVSEEDLKHAFNKARGFFRSHLAQELNLRIVPALRFIYDDSMEYGRKMSALIESARKDDQAIIDSENNDEQSQNEDKNNQETKDKRKRLR